MYYISNFNSLSLETFKVADTHTHMCIQKNLSTKVKNSFKTLKLQKLRGEFHKNSTTKVVIKKG